MTKDKDGFAVDVDELEKIANAYLPEAAAALRAVVHVIPESVQGTGQFPAMSAMADALMDYIFAVGRRQATGCQRIGEDAEALLDIARLYRRVDGQN